MNHCRAKMSEAHTPEALSVPWPDYLTHSRGAAVFIEQDRVVTDARKCLGPWDSHGPHLPLLLRARFFAMGSASS